jgi:hypothetical protein
VQRLRGTGAGRNNLTVIDCTDCVFEDLILEEAYSGNFDIEPDSTANRVENVFLVDSLLREAGGQCIHATHSTSGAPIHALRFIDNIVSDCHLRGAGGQGAGVVLNDVEDVLISSNIFENIDLYGAGGADSRSVIDMHEARNVVIRYNRFDTIDYDPRNSSIFYFWNDASGNQASHAVFMNDLVHLPSTTQWCWVSSTSSFRSAVQNSVFTNTIEGRLQHPNPGCY